MRYSWTSAKEVFLNLTVRSVRSALRIAFSLSVSLRAVLRLLVRSCQSLGNSMSPPAGVDDFSMSRKAPSRLRSRSFFSLRSVAI